MPFIRALSLCAFALFGLVAAAHAQDVPTCRDEKLFGDERRFECRIEVAANAVPPRFIALFSGGHDDTKASLEVHIRGVNALCGTGSKADLEGEYGNVSLLCHLPVRDLLPGQHVVTVRLRWRHAEYEGYQIEY